MMKHQWTGALVGAALLGIPAIASQEAGSMRSLNAALEATHSALEELMGLEPRLADHDPTAMARLIELTEEPRESPQAIDERVVRLRSDIQRLQSALDQGPSVNGAQTPATPSSGLQASDIDQIQTQDVKKTNKATVSQPREVRQFEQDGYSADEMHKAKLLVRSGKFEQAIVVLRAEPTTPESRYWLARALQGNQETGESRELLRNLSAEGEQAHRYARWAAQDLRMIELREKLGQQAKPDSKVLGEPKSESQSKSQPKPKAESEPKQ